MATRLDAKFFDIQDAAAFLATVVTCFTCPVMDCTFDSCGGACEEVLAEWLAGEDDD